MDASPLNLLGSLETTTYSIAPHKPQGIYHALGQRVPSGQVEALVGGSAVPFFLAQRGMQPTRQAALGENFSARATIQPNGSVSPKVPRNYYYRYPNASATN